MDKSMQTCGNYFTDLIDFTQLFKCCLADGVERAEVFGNRRSDLSPNVSNR